MLTMKPKMARCSAFALCTTLLQCAAAAVVSQPLLPFVYGDIPLGSITPNGWLRSEMETEASGLAGNLYNFWEYVHDSSWLNGTTEYSGLNEAFPYWLNGLVPLAYTLDDQNLKNQVHGAVTYVLENKVASDGWIGPEVGGYRLIWARTLIFMAFTNLVDANKTWEEPIVSAMHNFNSLMNSMLKDNGTGIVPQAGGVLDPGYYFWFMSRTQDMILSLQWLYDKYPQGQEEILMENMQMLHFYGYKWEDWFTWGTYVWQDLYDVPASVSDDNFQFLHGVNVGEGLKAAAVIRRFTHNESLIQTARDGTNWTFKYHGSASGSVLADEREDGTNPYYGSETCTNVEVMFSQSYNYRALGESFYADGSELAAYNALPAAMTGDWWAHVYMSQPNQPYSKNLSATPFYDVNSWGQTYGLEPNYPCCTANHPQGLPKFAQAAYMTVGDNGILHALLSPTTVSTSLASGKVTIECQTNYPFEDVLHYTIQAENPFDFYIRIPTWAVSSTVSSQSGVATLDSSKGVHQISLPRGNSTVNFTIETAVRTELRANDTVAVYRGQLLYAVEIGAEVSSTVPRNYFNQSFYPVNYAPPQSRDFTMINTTEWNIAIDPSTLKYFPASAASSSSSNISSVSSAAPPFKPLPTPIFAAGAPPMYITAKACLIDWPLFVGSVPGAPIPKEKRKCLGDVFETKLVPYGSAKLRMGELPTIELS